MVAPFLADSHPILAPPGPSYPAACDPDKGQFQLASGQASCDQCDADFYLDTQATPVTCRRCGAGESSAVGSTACTPCAGGTAKAAGDSACSLCPAGSYAGSGATECVPCTSGFYQDMSGQTSCKACGEREYQSDPGGTDCIACPAGFTPMDADAKAVLSAATDCQGACGEAKGGWREQGRKERGF